MRLISTPYARCALKSNRIWQTQQKLSRCCYSRCKIPYSTFCVHLETIRKNALTNCHILRCLKYTKANVRWYLVPLMSLNVLILSCATFLKNILPRFMLDVLTPSCYSPSYLALFCGRYDHRKSSVAPIAIFGCTCLSPIYSRKVR